MCVSLRLLPVCRRTIHVASVPESSHSLSSWQCSLMFARVTALNNSCTDAQSHKVVERSLLNCLCSTTGGRGGGTSRGISRFQQASRKVSFPGPPPSCRRRCRQRAEHCLTQSTEFVVIADRSHVFARPHTSKRARCCRVRKSVEQRPVFDTVVPPGLAPGVPRSQDCRTPLRRATAQQALCM